MDSQNFNWILRRWGISELVPIDIIEDRLQKLEDRVKVLEEENIGLTNALYEIANSLEARIDILTSQKWIQNDV